MNAESYIKQLCDLSQLDIDAVNAYETALKHIDDPKIHQEIEQFRQDHLTHVKDLNNLIQKYGGTPPEFTKDLKGYGIEMMTALRSIVGMKGALKAMKTNEILVNKKYAQSFENTGIFPEDIRSLIQKNYGDEKRHLTYIEDALRLLDA
jgi:demethoxyubiquinone hydroxylase (CLK1/Coq7/Cat5 family)